MTRLPSRRRRWLFPAAAVLVGGASSWAFMHTPRSNLLGHARIYSSSLTMAAEEMRDRWTMHLSLDPAAQPPGPRWILHDGKQAGDGYELRWLPEKLGLLVYRAPDQFLLGSARLERMPRTIDFSRRGAWLTVVADGATVLSCLDALGPSKDSKAWGFDTAGASSLGAAEITLVRDAPGDAGETRRDQAAVERVRAVLLAEPTKQPLPEIERQLGEAVETLRDLPMGSALHDRLRPWLALAQAQLALGRPDGGDSASRARDAVEQLALLHDTTAAPETAGMLMSLLPRLAHHACFRPPVPTMPDEVLAARALWLDVLGAAAAAALGACGGGVGDDLQYQLRLLAHAAACVQPLAGRPARDERSPDGWRGEPQPAPAEAPPWLGSRWRAFAGGDPGVADYPDMPGSSRDPVAVAIQQLMQATMLEPVSAVTMRHRLEQLLATKEVAAALADSDAKGGRETLARAAADAQAIREAGPPRESALAQALLALRGLGSKEVACQALLAPFAGGPPLAQRDPLAYAIVSLLLSRDNDLVPLVPQALKPADPTQESLLGPLTGSEALRKPHNLPELARFEDLLSGSRETDPHHPEREATALAWLQDPSVLPPAQALATALAMQESRPARKPPPAPPAWTLLQQARCYTLPLALMVPPEQHAAESVQPGDKTAPVPVAPP